MNVADAISCTVPGTVNVVTVTVNVPTDVLPAESVALHETVVVPTGNVEPLTGAQMAGTAP